MHKKIDVTFSMNLDVHKIHLENLAPKKFLCRYDLKLGCTVIGVVQALIMLVRIVVTIIIAVQGMDACEFCGFNSWKHAYSYSVSACIYCCLMFIVNLWFLWGVEKEKKSMVLSWVVVSTVWLLQTTCLLIVLLVEYFEILSLAIWLLCLFGTIISFVVLAYFIMVVYAFWLQLRDRTAIR